MRSFKAAPEVLSAWMDERKLTAAELSRQTGIDAGILRKIMTGRETAFVFTSLTAMFFRASPCIFAQSCPFSTSGTSEPVGSMIVCPRACAMA